MLRQLQAGTLPSTVCETWCPGRLGPRFCAGLSVPAFVQQMEIFALDYRGCRSDVWCNKHIRPKQGTVLAALCHALAECVQLR